MSNKMEKMVQIIGGHKTDDGVFVPNHKLTVEVPEKELAFELRRNWELCTQPVIMLRNLR